MRKKLMNLKVSKKRIKPMKRTIMKLRMSSHRLLKILTNNKVIALCKEALQNRIKQVQKSRQEKCFRKMSRLKHNQIKMKLSKSNLQKLKEMKI
jgi:hypothetical protein